MAGGKPYSPLGNKIDELARKRNVRGPYEIARRVTERTGEGPTGSAWSQILYGKTKKTSNHTMILFADAFDLTEKEREELALLYTYSSREPVQPST